MHQNYRVTNTMPNLESLVLKVPILATRGQKVLFLGLHNYISAHRLDGPMYYTSKWLYEWHNDGSSSAYRLDGLHAWKIWHHNHNAKSGKFGSKSSNFSYQGPKNAVFGFVQLYFHSQTRWILNLTYLLWCYLSSYKFSSVWRAGSIMCWSILYLNKDILNKKVISNKNTISSFQYSTKRTTENGMRTIITMHPLKFLDLAQTLEQNKNWS